MRAYPVNKIPFNKVSTRIWVSKVKGVLGTKVFVRNLDRMTHRQHLRVERSSKYGNIANIGGSNGMRRQEGGPRQNKHLLHLLYPHVVRLRYLFSLTAVLLSIVFGEEALCDSVHVQSLPIRGKAERGALPCRQRCQGGRASMLL